MKSILPSKGCDVNIGNDSGNDSGVKPPYSNTGAENTKVGIDALIDWCSFTMPGNDLEDVKFVSEQILKIPFAELISIPKGGNGYKSQLRFGDIAIFYDGQPEMGIHVCMTGQGCRQYEARFGNIWKELFKFVFNINGHFARLDTALDDYRGRFTVRDIADKVRRREVSTYFRGKPQIIESHDLQSEPGKNDGESVYFGSGQSDLRIRFYNKAVEQGVNYPWVRVETQCRNERADIMAKMIMCGGDEELGKIVSGVLRHYVNFLEPSETDTNKARWVVSSWWSEFLGCVERVRLTIQKAVKTIKETMDWIHRQVSKSLSKVDIYLDSKGLDAYDWIGELLSEGRSRFKPSDLAQLQAAGVSM